MATTNTASAMSANQLVAFNLRRAREESGDTQQQVALKLDPYLGKRWSKASFSIAERSADEGGRPREFSAEEILAFSQVFRKPIAWFFTPPPAVDAFRCGKPLDITRTVGRAALLEAVVPVPFGEDLGAILRQVANSIDKRETGRQIANRRRKGKRDA